MQSAHVREENAAPTARGRGILRRLLVHGSILGIESLMLIAIAAAFTGIISWLAPQLDLLIAGLFYDSAARNFPAAQNPDLAALRDTGYATVIACVGILVATLTTKLLLPARPLLVPGRAVIFLALTLAIGPGLIVNGILKAHWGRPRPIEVTQFGGVEAYVPWFSTKGTCTSNCSFVSGESATAAWMFGPAILTPPPWRVAALAAATVFTVTLSVLRMAFGGHFLTDVVFGILMTGLVIWIMHGLIYRWRLTRLSEQAIDRTLERWSCRIRGRFARRGAPEPVAPKAEPGEPPSAKAA